METCIFRLTWHDANLHDTHHERHTLSAHALRVSVLWLLLGCGVSVGAWGQSLVISGTLRNEDTRDKMDNVTVTVLQNGEAFDQIDVDRNGKYFLDVPLRSDYHD